MSNQFNSLEFANLTSLQIPVIIEIPVGNTVFKGTFEAQERKVILVEKDDIQTLLIHAAYNDKDHGADLSIDISDAIKPFKTYIESMIVKFSVGELYGTANLMISQTKS